MFNEVCTRKSIPSFEQVLQQHGLESPMYRGASKTLQFNIGKLCNMTCHHCHVEAGPTKTRENANRITLDRVLQVMNASKNIETIDITGGAPELNPHFKYLVREARKVNKKVIDRCNLTVFFEKDMETLPQFLADNQVEIVASLPCYSPANVEKQRGKGVFDKSIEALIIANKLGYGVPGSNLTLSLVYNPIGTSLPGPQKQLEEDYKRELRKHMGIEFNNLYTITNMPIKRYADMLFNTGEYASYMELLVNNFNPSTVKGLMCRDQVSVSWDGKIFDCDFNQMLEIDAAAATSKLSSQKSNGNSPKKNSLTVWDIESFDEMAGEQIATERHCFGCTAGAGSSCGGAVL